MQRSNNFLLRTYRICISHSPQTFLSAPQIRSRGVRHGSRLGLRQGHPVQRALRRLRHPVHSLGHRLENCGDSNSHSFRQAPGALRQGRLHGRGRLGDGGRQACEPRLQRDQEGAAEKVDRAGFRGREV